MSSPQLYAELLLNIRSMTVFASSELPFSSDTTGDLAPDLRHFTIRHGGHSNSITLPCQVVEADPNQHLEPAKSGQDIVFRFIPMSDELAALSAGDDTSLTPWTAESLGTTSCIHCRHCRRTIVNCAMIDTWNDLPSDNWAEMMDFWHCHKPREQEDANGNTIASQKGYGSSNQITARARMGLVGALHILFAPEDTESLMVSLLS